MKMKILKIGLFAFVLGVAIISRPSVVRADAGYNDRGDYCQDGVCEDETGSGGPCSLYEDHDGWDMCLN